METQYIEIDTRGSKFYYNNRAMTTRHRTDGPAVEWSNGDKEWWVKGKRHREDGPAVENANGSQSWYINEKRHRTDGPAIEHPSGKKEWWLDGEGLTEEEFLRQTAPEIVLTLDEIAAKLGIEVSKLKIKK